MDITFKTEEGRFNYRVCAIILNNGKNDDRSPYYYLPGGRVQLHETAETAVLREVKEELAIDAKILRPLWLNQGFFVEDVNGEKFHELCLYFLVDVSTTDLLQKGERFLQREGSRTHEFEWLAFERLEGEYFYPLFLKKEIFNLPKDLKMIAEFE